MKKLFFLISALLFVLTSYAQSFEDNFYDKTMRFDYFHCGNNKSEEFYFKEIKEEPFWGGTRVNLIDKTEYGNLFFKIIDKKRGELIYSNGFNSLFNEWQHTKEALKSNKGYNESLIFPYPKNDIIIEIYSRNFNTTKFEKKFELEITSNHYQTIPHKKNDTEVIDIEINGETQNTIDIVLLSEGYSKKNKAKFINDAKIFRESLFSFSPFKDRRTKFNIRAVWCGDQYDDGVSIPKDSVWHKTPLGSKFYTFDSERYQMVNDFQIVRDYAANAPYDFIYILTNSEKYGGGGIYNFYGISSANHSTLTKEIYVHEFGHLFLGLADEYEGGSEPMYNLKTEPWEQNITTLIDFNSKEWSKMVDKSTKIPTSINESNKNIVGVYQGAAYQNHGIYRPWLNCIMRHLNDTKGFCPVCNHVLMKHIDYLSE